MGLMDKLWNHEQTLESQSARKGETKPNKLEKHPSCGVLVSAKKLDVQTIR